MRLKAFAILLLIATSTLGFGCANSLHHQPVQRAQHQPEVAGFDGRLFIDEPSFYFCGQPTEEGFRELRERGVETVLNLRTDREMAEAVAFDEEQIVQALGMRYERLPISTSTFSINDVDRFEEILRSTNRPIAIHCASSGRVGGLWAAYLAIKRGAPIDEAIEVGRAAGLSSDSMMRAVRATVAAAQEDGRVND